MCLLSVCGLTSAVNLLTVGTFFLTSLFYNFRRLVFQGTPFLKNERREGKLKLPMPMLGLLWFMKANYDERKNRANNDNRNFSTLIALDWDAHETARRWRYQEKAVNCKYEKYLISSVRVSNCNPIRWKCFVSLFIGFNRLGFLSERSEQVKYIYILLWQDYRRFPEPSLWTPRVGGG